jgi:hypothetical protein
MHFVLDPPTPIREAGAGPSQADTGRGGSPALHKLLRKSGDTPRVACLGLVGQGVADRELSEMNSAAGCPTILREGSSPKAETRDPTFRDLRGSVTPATAGGIKPDRRSRARQKNQPARQPIRDPDHKSKGDIRLTVESRRWLDSYDRVKTRLRWLWGSEKSSVCFGARR